MIKAAKVGWIVMMGSSLLMAGANQMQKYEIESGKITYKITGSTDMMGMKIKTIGKKRVIFDDYGVQNLSEESQVSKQTMGGESKTTKSHAMVYMKGSMLYQTDFDAKRITRMQNPAAAMMMMSGGKNAQQTGEAMMKSMGGKKSGTDKVLGYTCDVWELMGTKQCIYKGIPLKVESNIMGVKNTEIATEANFDISISKDDFKLPDFPVYSMDGEQLDKSKLESMDKKSETNTAEAGESMAELGALMAGAMQSAGVKKGESPTKAQEKVMEDALMASMMPRVKQQMLSQEKMLQFGKECLSKADTLKEANVCSRKMDEMSGEEDEDFTEWNEKTKKEMLGFIDQGLAGVECVKKAETMDVIKQCMSEE